MRIIDASFIWTEPHSRRIKVKITIQQEAFQNTILQQSFEVEYVLANQQCPDCAKSYTHNTWRACVQVRQKVTHKRTFLYLEQLILKHSAHRDTINIKETHEGIDFFFAARNQAEKFVDFLKSVVPVTSKKSQELISMDTHTAIKSYKFSFSVEIVPICKDDLVVLPIKLAKQMGNIPPLTLCNRIGTAIQVLHPQTLQTADISPDVFWRAPFTPLADVTELAEFIILDIEPLGPVKGRYVLAEATVARASDLGTNDQSFYTRTHLGGILNVGDSVLGYALAGSNFNNELFDELENSKAYSGSIPDVVLVKKHYERKKKNKRNWKVKRMAKEESEMLPRKQDQERLERDFEMFLRDVEEDEDFRAGISLYKSQHAPKPADPEEMDEDDEVEDGQGPHIPMEQLLEEMEDLNMDEGEEV